MPATLEFPPVSPRPCATCRGLAGRGFCVCSSCDEIARQLAMPLVPVLPVTLAQRRSDLALLVTAYKVDPDPARQLCASRQVGTLLGDWIESHLEDLRLPGPEEIAGRRRPAAALVAVPSSGRGRASWHGRHPLCDVIDAVAGRVGLQRVEALLARGTASTRHRVASREGYRVVRPVEPVPLVVVDDTYASGARAQSAAAALRVAGARVIAIVPVVRIVAAEHPQLAATVDPSVTRPARPARHPAEQVAWARRKDAA